MTIRKISKQAVLSLLATGILSLAGIAQQAPATAPPAPAPEKPAGATSENPKKVVLKVGTQNYTVADMDFLIGTLSPRLQVVVAQQGKKPLGDQFAMMAMLSQQAEKDRLDATEDFREEMALHRLQTLAEAEYRKMSDGIKVSPEEINQYYTAHASEFEEAQVREIIIRKKADGAEKDAPGLTSADAHARAEDIRKALEAGTDPKKVADQYKVENTVMFDSEPRMIKRGQLIADLDKAAFELKDGAVSQPFENAQALAFLQVVGHRHQELKEVSDNIEKTLHEQKLQSAVDELKKNSSIWMDDQYFKAPAESPAAPSSEPEP
jgi:peptidyl-prolyl cis-trans isomerase C